MSHDQPFPTRPSDQRDADVPPSVLAHETGLGPQRIRELIARADDADARREDGAGRHAAQR